jgi:hypothetical protein
MEGSEKELFQKLPAFCEAIRAGGGGTYCKMETGVNLFHCFFVAPRSSGQGWCACSQFLAVDRTFLKGSFKLTLLAAVTLDRNDVALFLAWGIVLGNCEEHWS